MRRFSSKRPSRTDAESSPIPLLRFMLLACIIGCQKNSIIEVTCKYGLLNPIRLSGPKPNPPALGSGSFRTPLTDPHADITNSINILAIQRCTYLHDCRYPFVHPRSYVGPKLDFAIRFAVTRRTCVSSVFTSRQFQTTGYVQKEKIMFFHS